MKSQRAQSPLRGAIAREAARIMYEEEVKQYFTAKRMASRRLLGRQGGRKLRYRPADLPSNGEIRQELLCLAELVEGEGRRRRLFAMRVVALEAMEALQPFSPRLIGSVVTGHVRRGSDIDLHVFPEDPDRPDRLLGHLSDLGWTYETQRVSVCKGSEIRDYLHVYVVDLFPLELSIYGPLELRMRTRSSTDGKPIVRLSVQALRALIAREHPNEWAAYRRDEAIPGLEDLEILSLSDSVSLPGVQRSFEADEPAD